MREHRVNYNQGAQTIRTIAVSSDLGLPVRPSAATLQIVDLRYSDTDANHSVVDAVAATVDAVSTTTTAACGRSSSAPSTITLSTVAGVTVGRRYLLTNATGRSEIVTASAVDAVAKTVLALHEPQYAYPTGATFKGLEVSGSVPAGVCNADESFDSLLAAVWTFTGVEPARVMERIELVRPLPSWATVDDMQRLEPGLTTRNADLANALAMAHEDFATDMRLAGLDPNKHNPGPLGRTAVVYLACYHVLKSQESEAARERAAVYLKRYDRCVLGLTVGKDKAGVTEIEQTTGAAKSVDVRSLFGGL